VGGACFTIEKFPKGYGWRLRDLDHGVDRCLDRSLRFAGRGRAWRGARPQVHRPRAHPRPHRRTPTRVLIDLARLELTRAG